MRIRSLSILVLASALSVFATEPKSKTVSVRDWVVTVPTATEVRSKEGPDFSLSYFIFPLPMSEFGIYEGAHPKEFADGQKNTRKQKDHIGGQDIVWTLWKEKTGGGDVFRGELILTFISSNASTANFPLSTKLHIFLAAEDQSSFIALQNAVRTLRQQPNKPPEPTP